MWALSTAYAETQNCREREQGFREVLLGDSRVKGIYAVNVSTDALEARLAAEKLLREHPEINVLIGFNEPLAVGVAQAVDSLGLTGQVHAVCLRQRTSTASSCCKRGRWPPWWCRIPTPWGIWA